MADLVADNNDITPDGGSYDFEVTADSSTAQTIYKGHPLIIDASADTVHVRAWNSGDAFDRTLDIFVGLAAEGAVISQGSSEAANTLNAWTGVISIPNDQGWTDSTIGLDVWMPDSGTFELSRTAGALFIGKIYSIAVDDADVFIALKDPQPYFDSISADPLPFAQVHDLVSTSHEFAGSAAGDLLGAPEAGVIGKVTPAADDFNLGATLSIKRRLSGATGPLLDGTWNIAAGYPLGIHFYNTTYKTLWIHAADGVWSPI